MARLRADLHKSFKGSPFLKTVREVLSNTTPEKLMQVLGIQGLVNKNEYQESNDDLSWVFSGEKSITTLDEALEFCNVDLDEWKVDRHLFNSWDVTSKDFGKRTNYQVKVFFKRKDNTFKELASQLKKAYNTKLSPTYVDGTGHGVLSIADLHIGAEVKDLILTPDFNLDKLISYLNRAADEINAEGYDRVTLNIIGDLVESISGLNHLSTWKSISKDGYGAKVLITAYEVIRDHLILRINNLVKINMVAGNHDRFTMSSKVDNEGGGASVLAYFLDQNVDVELEYDDVIIVDVIDGIEYFITHGHHTMSKTPIKIAFDYGKTNLFKVVLSAHYHTRVTNKVSSKKPITYKGISVVGLDELKFRHMIIASIFTGNLYSETLGHTSSSGCTITYNNGYGYINSHDRCLNY